MTSQPQLKQPSITSFREELLRKIKENGDITETITQILSCDGNLSQRYSLLPMSNLIQNNSQSLDRIKRFGLALNILEKYCRHLLKPQEIRSQMWRYVKFTNNIFRDRIDIIKGGRDIMKLMGYTTDIKDGLAFPSTAVTDDETLTNLLADILIGKRELDAFITNEHPNTKSINILLPANTFLELKKMHSRISRQESLQASSTDNTSRPQEPPHQQYPPTPAAGGYKPVQQQSSVGNGDTEETVVKMSNYNPAAYGYVENSPVNYVAPNVAGQQLPMQNVIEAPTVLVQDQPITAQIPSSAVQSAQGLTNQVIPDTNQTRQTDKLSSEKLESIVCDICGDSTAEFVCDKCDNKQLCSTCDERWHQHPKRISHERQNIHRLPSNSNRSSNENNSVYLTPNEHMPPAPSTLHPQQHVPPPPAAHLPPCGHEYVNTMPIAHPQSEEARMNKLQEQVPYVPEMYSNVNNSKASEQVPYVQHMPEMYSNVNNSKANEQVPYVQQMPEIYGKSAISKTGEQLPYVQQVPGAISKVPSSMAVGHPASGQMNISAQNPTLPAWPQQLSPKQGQIVQMMPQSSSPHIMPQGGVPSFSMMHSFTPSPQAGSMTPPLHKVPQNYPNSSAPGGPPTSKLLAKIMAVPDLNKRRSKVDIDLVFLEEEMEHVDKKIETISIQNPKFYEDEEYATLYRKKGMLQRERMQLEKYGKELDGMLEENIKSQQHGDQGHGDILHQQIFYPPSYVPMTYTPGVPTPTLSIPLGQQQQPLNQGTISKQGVAYYLIPSFPNQTIGHPSHQVLVHSPPGTSDLQGQGYLGSIPMPTNHSNYLPAQIQGQDQSQHMNQNPVYQRYLHQNSVQGVSVQCTSPGMSVCSPGVAPTSPKQIPLNIPPESHVEPKISNLQSNPMTIGKPISQDHSNKAAQLTQKHQTPGNRNSSKFQDYPPSAQTIFENYPQPPDVTEPPKVPQPIMPSDHTGDTIKKKSEGYGTAWICQHCTFHNSPNTRVCEVCFKTSISPKFLSDEGTTTSGSKKPPQVAAAAVFRAETEVREAEHDKTRSEETEVLAMASNTAKRIQQNYDQIYYEKKEAHRKFQEQLEREKSAHNQNVNGQPGQALTVESSDQSQFAASKPLSSSPVTSHLEPSAISESDKNVESSSIAIEPKSSEAAGILKKSKIPTGSPSSKPTLNFTETMEKINQKRQQDIMMIEGREVVKLLKTAEEDGFTAEEAEIALEKCIQDNLTPIAWLKEKWQPMLDTVVTMTTIAGTNMDMNEVGELSIVEARKALKEWGGDVEAAVKQCVETRQKMYKEISLIDNYPREEILSAMLHGQGDISIALDDLNTNRLQQFLDRLWLYDETPQSPEREVETHDVCNSVTNSVLRHTDFQALIRDTTVDKERRIRMIMVEGKLQSWGRASTVIRILDHDVASNGLEATLEEIVEAVKNCGDRQSSLVYLQQECQICFSLYPMSKIRSLNCPCKICADCMKSYFEITIREKHVRNLSCPNCQQPDMENTEAASEYLAFLTMMLGAMVSTEILELYQIKLRDWHLQRDPNFRWCTHCGGGFIYQYGYRQLAMQCPHCHHKTCFKCKKQWEDQHEGLTCEEYEQWKIDNDPENQTIGLAAHLEANGIDCPSCKMRYSLAKGGCMHFKCPECGHEFCSGCSQQFFLQGTCNRFKSCRTKGLHCHHPRDCFYYLRDYDTDQLQNLLTEKGIDFDTDTPANQVDPNHCPVMEQKEVMDKKNDEACGKEVAEGQAGLCLNHYKEYLVGLINRNKVDPIDVMNSDEIIRLIDRQEKTAPKMKPNYQAQQYRKKLIQFVKENIPLLR